jgi:hypothetical protein
MTAVDHFHAVMALTVDLPFDVWAVGDVPAEPTFPYAVITPPGHHLVSSDLADATDDIDDYYLVTSTGLTVESALVVQDAMRVRLHRAEPAVAGWSTTLRRNSTGRTAQDTDVTIPDTNSHPIFAVDSYRIESTKYV